VSGEAFEHAVALLLNALGFQVISPDPYRVKIGGQVVGDLDVVCRHKETGTIIGVQCKDWSSPPGAEQLDHFAATLERVKLRHGIFITRGPVAETLYTLARDYKRKGLNIAIIDGDTYDKLRRLVHEGNRAEAIALLEEYLNLSSNTSQLAEITDSLPKKVERVIPPFVWNEISPPYLKAPYPFKRTRAILELRPYLVIHYYIYDELRSPRTGELLDSVEEEDHIIYDAYTGKEVKRDDVIYRNLKEFSSEVVDEYLFECDTYDVKVPEIAINKSAFIQKAKIEVSRNLFLEGEYELSSGEIKRIVRQIKPEKIKILKSEIIRLPIWHMMYETHGPFNYERQYLGTDGTVIKDEMALCLICKSKPTSYLCKACGIAICENHAIQCSVCEEYFCLNEAVLCVECGRGFCMDHAPPYRCKVCNEVLCNDDYKVCVVCGQPVCSQHSVRCEVCGNIVCRDHALKKKKYLIKTIYFCSQECMSAYGH